MQENNHMVERKAVKVVILIATQLLKHLKALIRKK
jgi:hypothetical protein